MKSDLDVIKYRFGECMMRLCRDKLGKFLEVPGLLPKLLDQYFYRSKFLAEDIISQGQVEDFKDFLSIKAKFKPQKINVSNKKAIELLEEKGYSLYECLTEKDIQSFRHYFYRPDGKKASFVEGKTPQRHVGEELCTFSGGRLLSNRVWFAVHKDADKLNRSDFRNPNRQDAYGTSVLSIQFSKNEYSTLSIKNRYNHTVYNPDSTFNNNLDNIVPGLSMAFERDYGVSDKIRKEKCNFELYGYVMAGDSKFYPYNYEIDNVYYCPNNIIIDNFEVKLLPTHQILVDYFIFDFKTKKVTTYEKGNLYDGFVEDLQENRLIKMEKNGVIKIIKKDGGIVTLSINKRNQMETLEDNSLRKCAFKYLSENIYLKKISLPKVQECLSSFLYYNDSLTSLYMPSLHKCKDFFLYNNDVLNELNLPSLQICGDYFFYLNNLKIVNLPQLQKCGHDFLYCAQELTQAIFPSLRECGNNFLSSSNIKEIQAPNLKICGGNFLYYNEAIKILSLPQLQSCGIGFMYCNEILEKLDLKELQTCGNGFMAWNQALTELYLPQLQECGASFLYHNEKLKKVFLPNLEITRDDFLHYNEALEQLYLPLLKVIGNNFLYYNNSLKEVILPNLYKCGANFMYHNNSLTKLIIKSLQICGGNFLYNNNSLNRIHVPLLVERDESFMQHNNSCREYSNQKVSKLKRLKWFQLCFDRISLKLKNKTVMNQSSRNLR